MIAYRPAFYLYAVLKVLSGALMLSIDLEFKQPAQNLLEDVISVFRNIEIVALFIACFIMGKNVLFTFKNAKKVYAKERYFKLFRSTTTYIIFVGI